MWAGGFDGAKLGPVDAAVAASGLLRSMQMNIGAFYFLFNPLVSENYVSSWGSQFRLLPFLAFVAFLSGRITTYP